MLTPEQIEEKDRLLEAMLPHVMFDGWSKTALAAAEKECGTAVRSTNLVFPGGLTEAALHFGDYIDRKMIAELDKLKLLEMPVRDRITTGVWVRLGLLSPYRESIRRLLTYLSLPGNQLIGFRITMRTVDAIWHAAGDTATDFNYYTKRGLLAGVYGSTILYWLSDNSEDFVETRAFLERRIAEVLQIPKYQNKLKKRLGQLTRPLQRFRRPVFR